MKCIPCLAVPLAVLLAFMAPALPAQDAEPKQPEVATTEPTARRELASRGVDLTTLQWYASAELGPGATPEEIAAGATPTTPTVQIRTEPGTSATLFTIIEVAEPPAMGAVITIADIDGEDLTSFNGTAIGETSATGISDHGVPRVYYVERAAIRQGRNVLAVQLRGIGGSGTFGIRRVPITFGFVPRPPESHAFITPDPRRGVAPISEEQARAAITAADPGTSGGQPVHRKRPSFGRFGEFFHDGLPAVSELSPTHIANRGAPRIEVVLDAVDAISLAAEGDEPGIDGWHKLSRVDGKVAGKKIRYTALAHLFYPGTVFTLEEGGYFQFRISFAGGTGVLHLLDETLAEAALPGFADAGLSAFAVFEPRANSLPAIVVVESGAANATQAGSQIDLTVTTAENGDGSPARVFVFYPSGLRLMDLSAKPASFSALVGAVSPDLPPAEALAGWLRLGLSLPAAVDEYFRVRPEANMVRVYQLTRYRAPEGASSLKPLILLPPQIPFAMRELNYPAVTPPTTSTGVLAYSGPLHCVDETTATPPAPDDNGLYVATYDLPIPPMSERGIIEVPGGQELRALLNDSLTDLATTAALNGVDAFYKSRTQGYQAWAYLTSSTRAALNANSAEIVPAALTQSRWYSSVEPLSGLITHWTYYIEGPYYQRYDQDWGNGLSLYGLYRYVKHSGEWALAARHWDAIERMFSWFPATDDWEWMRASNGSHGHGTGAGDCMNATYAAALAYAKLARNTGRTDEHDHGLYTAARAALPMLNRFVYNSFAEQYEFRPPNTIVLGFHEGRGFLVGEMNGYPWNATSTISGNGVQPENFDLILRHAPDALRDYANAFDRAYPDWADGSHEYPAATIYRGNSGYISLPHIYLRARLGSASTEALRTMIESASSNKYLWWIAPAVLAEVLNTRNPALVADWGRCAFLDARVETIGETRRIVLTVENRFPPDEVIIAVPREPDLIEINGGPVPLTDKRFENGRQWLRLRRAGVNTVVFGF